MKQTSIACTPDRHTFSVSGIQPMYTPCWEMLRDLYEGKVVGVDYPSVRKALVTRGYAVYIEGTLRVTDEGRSAYEYYSFSDARTRKLTKWSAKPGLRGTIGYATSPHYRVNPFGRE